MFVKVIRDLLTFLRNTTFNSSFENKVVLYSSLYSCFMCFVAIAGNAYLKLNFYSILLVIVSFPIYAITVALVRFFNRPRLAKLIFSYYGLLFCNLYWYANYGSKGSAIYVYLAYYSVLIFIWEFRQVRIITLLVFINLIVLFVIELNFPSIIPQYPSEWVRIVDSYSFLFLITGVFSILIVSAKNNYIKLYKEAQRSDKLKSAFLANISHEIHTPLNAILGFSNIITRRELTKEKKELYTKLINENGDYLMKMVSDMLDISMIESGQLRIDFKQTDLHQIFVKLHFNFLQLLNQQEKTHIHFSISEPKKNVVFYTDNVRLEQILTNLLSNAVKFTDEGSIKFGYKPIDDYILFYVEDTGRGIKEDKQPEIFERFAKDERDLEANFTKGGGIGLGG
jgi:signal transduction histidine kinase